MGKWIGMRIAMLVLATMGGENVEDVMVMGNVIAAMEKEQEINYLKSTSE